MPTSSLFTGLLSVEWEPFWDLHFFHASFAPSPFCGSPSALEPAIALRSSGWCLEPVQWNFVLFTLLPPQHTAFCLRWCRLNAERLSVLVRIPGPYFISLSVYTLLGWDFHFWQLRVTVSPCYWYLLCHFRKCRKIAVQFFQIYVYKSITPLLNSPLLWCDMKRKGSPCGFFPKETRRKWVNIPSISQGIMKHIKYYLRIIFTIMMFVFHQALGQLPWFVNDLSPCRQAGSSDYGYGKRSPYAWYAPETVSFFTLCDGVQA